VERSGALARLGEAYDVLVVGGGATGLGVAVDAAARGYRTLVVEGRDFAQGTSSRSTKLVHGGVRYLQQGNVGLVREALHERGLLLRNAPHLARELCFLLPAYKWWERPFYGLGLALYDLLAGSLKLTPTRVVDARTAVALAPTIRQAGLQGGVLYSDAQFDDARLAIILARTARERGAALLNYAPVRALLKTAGRVSGAVVADEVGGGEHAVRARVVVNATGVFSDTIRRMDDPAAEEIIAVSQGIHLVLDRSFLPGETAILVPHTDDGRVIFIIPWQGRALVGTTDTPMLAPTVEPTALASEVAYVLEHAGRYLAKRPTPADVLSVFAGLRPLVQGKGGRTATLSRDHALLLSDAGLVTIAGGKWTTYRRMAQDTVDLAAKAAGLPARPCLTASLRLYGADGPHGRWREFGATPGEIAAYEARYPGELHPNLPYSLAMAAYVIEREMAVKVEDVLSRRLRALILDARAALAVAPRVAHLMAALQGHDAAWERSELAAFRALASRYMVEQSEAEVTADG